MAPDLPCPGQPSSPPSWLDDCEDRAWRGWLAVSELLRAQIGRDLLVDSGLSEADYVVLVYLSEARDHRARMSDLAAALRWSKSRLSHQVARMEGRGLLAREGCGSDGRGAFAVLTEAGMAELRSAAPAHVASVRAHFVDLLSPEELEVFGEVTERLVRHLLTQPGAPAPPAPCGQGRPASGPADGGGGSAGKLVG